MTEELLATIQWYQQQFMQVKLDFLSRRGRTQNEVLCFVLVEGPRRVNYMSVDPGGVTICAEGGLSMYAAWEKGDRFIRMYESLAWGKLAEGIYSRQLKWDDYSAWEV